MGHVYLVSSLYATNCFYFNTAREADRCKPGGEEPESVNRLDAAAECNRLAKGVDEAERTAHTLMSLLRNLVDACPDDVLEETDAGRRAVNFVENHPLPAAGDGNRDGQRSYGGG